MIAPWPDLEPWTESEADRSMRLYFQSLDPDVVEGNRTIKFTGAEKRILDAKQAATRDTRAGFFFTQNQLDAAREAAERKHS